ncbi:MAG: ABC transporter permease [Verrucomicrobia bacterium]|nr:ABC transporter permease [Verrucomicrobiota bacterium]
MTPWRTRPKFGAVQKVLTKPSAESIKALVLRGPLPPSFVGFFGCKLLRLILTVQGLGAFALITLGVMFSKLGTARSVLRPLIRSQLAHAGVRLLPMVLFLSFALGLVVIGQTVSLLSRVGANEYLGTVMVTAVLRELGPLLTALLVLSRVGAANVIELATARALGEVEALEALGIDPIHYLVVPRVIGMALSVFALTIYLNLCALASGYLWAFLQDVPLKPGEYVQQIAGALEGLDFVLIALKTCFFGVIIATVTCYHGLAQPLRLEEVSAATIRAVAQCVILCVMLDALFIVIYLVG